MPKSKCKQCKEYFVRDSENPIEALWVKFCSKKCRISYIAQKNSEKREKEKIKNEKARKKKSDSITVLKKKLWETVSLYIRLRDSDDENFCTCCTCSEYRHYKDSIQAGHYIASGQSSFHRYNERNIHPQCYWCNIGKNGNVLEYREFMIKKYGQEYTDWLYETRNEPTNLWKEEIKELTIQYKQKLEELKSKKLLYNNTLWKH